MIRVGVLGYGFAGRGFHAYLLTHEPRMKLTAVATRDGGRRARAEADYGVATFESLDQMLESADVDLVVIATPHDVHAEQAIAVMDAGKHCVCDKVMCLTTAEADAIIEARDRNAVLFSVFHNRRWDGDYLTVRSALEAGLLGDPRFFEMGIWRFGPPRSWRGQKAAVGSIMHDWGAHFVDQMFLLVPGRVVSVRGLAQYDWPDLDIESYLGLEASFDNGVLFRIELSNRARLGKPHWFVVGSRGALVKDGVDPQEAAMLRGEILAAREDPANYARLTLEQAGTIAESRLQTIRGDWTSYYRGVANALCDGGAVEVTAEQARRGVRLLEAVQQSISGGDVVHFPCGL
jgi:scyllo-inositol 2-dehydrogenase (NADP+)